MEINITSLLAQDMFPFSHSAAEGGQDAGRNTWNNALNGPRPLLNTPEEFEAFRDHVGEFGAWEDEEIDGWTENECQALFLQIIAGDVREAGADSIDEIDWEQYEIDAEAGRNSSLLYRGGDGSVYYYLGC